MEILAHNGITVPRFSFVTNENDAVKKARALRFPVVGKIISPEILHKTDVKAIKMGLNSEAEVRQLFADGYRKLSRQYQVRCVLLEGGFTLKFSETCSFGSFQFPGKTY